MIIANHAHVFPKELREDGTLDELKKLMEACSIDKAVAFAPFADRFCECSIGGNPNDWLAKEIANDPDIYGFGTVDLERDDIADQIKHIADLGFKGLKMHPPYQEFVIDGEKAFQAYAAAEEAGLFISFHCGMHWHRLRDNLPILYDEVAWNFPRLSISLEHIGGYHFFTDALAVMCNNSRNKEGCVYAGWTSISDQNGIGSWTLTDTQLETVIRQTGVGRSMFGLDFPYNDADEINYDIARIKRLNIPDEAKENILGGTMAKILGI